MILNINGKDYQLDFGFDFIDYVNQQDGLAIQGINLGVAGMRMLPLGLDGKSPSTLRTIIKAGTITRPQKPSNEEVKAYIENLLNEEKFDDVFNEVLEEMGKHILVLREMGITKEEWTKNVTKAIMTEAME